MIWYLIILFMIKCTLCHSFKTIFFCKKHNFSYYTCKTCKTLFIRPQPNPQFLHLYYKNHFKYEAGLHNQNRIRKRSKIILNHLQRLNPTGKTILDIGSGFGYFLDEAIKRGFKPVGVEPAKKLLLYIANQFDTSDFSVGTFATGIYNMQFEKFYKQNKNRKFDFITIIHLIEHVLNPAELIAQAAKLLNKDGVLFIETPNLASHLFNFEGKNYTFLTPPEHLWIFSKSSLGFILKDIPSLKLKRINTYSYPEHFMGILKRIIKDDGYLSKKAVRRRLKPVSSSINFIRYLNYLLFDKVIANILHRSLNIGNKGSFLELYIQKI